MRVGFTGTRRGLSEKQIRVLTSTLQMMAGRISEVHHGDCIGADSMFHQIAGKFGLHRVIHPPLNSPLRAFCKGEDYRRPLPYLRRNQNIVNECVVLIACPGEATEQRRSGTWATIRMARRRTGMQLVVITP